MCIATFVLLQAENLELADVIDILRERHAAREAKAASAPEK